MINIDVGKQPEEPKQEKEKKESSLKYKLHIRKSLDGNLMIYSHEDLDLIIQQDKGKIIVLSTNQTANDIAYDSADRFFRYLTKKGIIEPSSVHAGHIFGSFEATLLKPKDTNINNIDMALLAIAKFIEAEKPNFVYMNSIKDQFVDDYTDPNEEDSTEMGEVPHRKVYDYTDGVMSPTTNRYEE